MDLECRFDLGGRSQVITWRYEGLERSDDLVRRPVDWAAVCPSFRGLSIGLTSRWLTA